MADAWPAPAAGDEVALELSEGLPVEAKVVWTQGGRFGAQFAAPRPVAEIIADRARAPGRQQRAVRVAPVSAFATIEVEGRSARAAILNISQTGVAIFGFALPLPAGPDYRILVEVDGLEPIAGALCWSADGAAGIRFDAPLSFEALSHWLWAASLSAMPQGAN
jgi:hypothetical protein